MRNARIESIDILRGFALLGILIMNISSFAMPSMAYFSPVVYAVNNMNHIVYSFTHIIADQKFMAIFSMLFGASTLLFINSAIKRGKNPLFLFYSRNFWLLIIGSIHSSYFWHGDILFIYALCSFPLYFFKNLSARKQFILGFLIYLTPSFSNYVAYKYVTDDLDPIAQNIMMKHWNPEDSKLQEEIDVYRGSYEKQFQYRAEMWSSNNENKDPSAEIGEGIIGLSYIIDFFSRSFGMMLIGMACFSWGVFNNTLSELFYKKLLIYGFGIGFPLSIIGLFFNYYFDWHWEYLQFFGRTPNHLATPFIAFGYISMIMLWIRQDNSRKIQKDLKAIGKTALTAYLIQTIIATFIFYGIGLGLFGYVSRAYQLVIMVFIWFVLIKICPFWLSKYHYGPVEWVWRMLTHYKWVQILRKNQ